MFSTVHVFKCQVPDVQLELRITHAQIPELCGSAWHFMHTYWENIFYIITLEHLLYMIYFLCLLTFVPFSLTT